MYCYRHPKTETAVRCGKCDRPICPRCMVPGPAGMRCPDCASLRRTALYRIHPARLLLAALAGLVTGVLGAYLMMLTGFFVFFVGPLYGGFVAEAVLRAAGRKRGRALEVIGVGGILVGAAVTLLPQLWMVTRAVSAGPAGGFAFAGLLWPLVGFGLAIPACYARLKYL
ncbi:MAG: hypothetical protein JO250_16530 [Armatimonadetes bacterium]|nr:hypothetical protein [Armatimonadota bacterium]